MSQYIIVIIIIIVINVIIIVNGYGPNGGAGTRAVHYDETVVDIVDRPYIASDGNLSYRQQDSDSDNDPTYEMPSHQIESKWLKSA